MTSRPARQNYKTGRSVVAPRGAPASGAGVMRASAVADALSTDPDVSRTVGGVFTRRAGRSAGTRARDERRYGARAQVLWAQQPPRAAAATHRTPRATRARHYAPTSTIYLPCYAGPPVRGRCPLSTLKCNLRKNTTSFCNIRNKFSNR